MLEHSERVRQILADLESLRENLLALSDDIWLSIDHNDQDTLDAGYEFKKTYNAKLADFDSVAEDLSGLVQRFTEIELEPDVDNLPAHQDRDERDRIVQELDRARPHSLAEDFTFKRPYGYSLHDAARKDVVTWKRFYQLVCRQLANYDVDLFQSLPEHSEFISNRGNPSFSRNPDSFRSPVDIGHGIYAEAHLSANHIRNMMRDLLTVFDINHDDLRIFLREDRDADGE